MAVPGIHSWLIVPRTGSGASEKNVLAPRPRGDLPVGKAGSSAAVQATDGEWDGLNGSLQPSNHLSVRVVGHDLQMDPAGVNVGEDHRVGKTPCHGGATVGDGVDLEESRIPLSLVSSSTDGDRVAQQVSVADGRASLEPHAGSFDLEVAVDRGRTHVLEFSTNRLAVSQASLNELTMPGQGVQPLAHRGSHVLARRAPHELPHPGQHGGSLR